MTTMQTDRPPIDVLVLGSSGGVGRAVLAQFANSNITSHTFGRYTSADNLLQFPNRKLWNGRVGLNSTNWTFTAYVNNILDDQTGEIPNPVINGWPGGSAGLASP